jgi:hypothetical protein
VYTDALEAYASEIGHLHAELDVVAGGALVIVRPDGYVGALVALNEGSTHIADALRRYFFKFVGGSEP